MRRQRFGKRAGEHRLANYTSCADLTRASRPPAPSVLDGRVKPGYEGEVVFLASPLLNTFSAGG
jgi:hypothetical protein